MNFIKKVLTALYMSFSGIIVFSVLILPFKIWLSSLDFLVNQYNEKNYIKRFSSSEMKVLSWITLFLNCLIFLSYILGIGLIISLFFKGFAADEIWGKSVFILFASYFSSIFFSFFKELISLKLLTYFKLENIENETRLK